MGQTLEDRQLVKRLIEIGVATRRKSPAAYARPSEDPEIASVGTARIANWLEKLGEYQLVGDVQPCFTNSGAGFQFRVTDKAAETYTDPARLEAALNAVVPQAPRYDVFISYAAGDAHIAAELHAEMKSSGLRCFMAEKDIPVATAWEDSVRGALIGSKRVLVLLTPRSINRPWVLLETGAAWALSKPLIPALFQVSASDLMDPMRKQQARVIETTAQRRSLIDELVCE